MTRILRNTVAAAFLTSAALMLAGCPTGVGANIPGTGGVLGASTAPGTTPTTGGGASACMSDSPAATPAKGQAKHGGYNAQNLPNGWDNLADEAAVTAAFKSAEGGANWACMQKFYAGAMTVYASKK